MRVPPPSGRPSHRPGRNSSRSPAHPLAGSFEAIGILLFGDLAATPGRGTDRGGSEIGRGDAGDAVDQLVGLVDHHDVVVRQDLDAGDGVDREQCVVGDHYVGLRRLDSGALGEAVLTDRALVLTDAFAGGDTDLPPRLIGYARHQFVPITGFGVGGPFGEADDLPAETRDRERIEQLVLGWLFGRAGVDLVHAQVVVAALEDCEICASAEWLLQASASRGRSRSTS